MRREEGNKYCLNKSNFFMWKKLRIKSLLIKKASEVREVLFEKCDESKYVSVEKNCGLKLF